MSMIPPNSNTKLLFSFPQLYYAVACSSLTFLCHPYLGISVSIRVNAIPWHSIAIPQQLISPLCKALPPHIQSLLFLYCSFLICSAAIPRYSIPSPFNPSLAIRRITILCPRFPLTQRICAFPWHILALLFHCISMLRFSISWQCCSGTVHFSSMHMQ